MMFLGLVQLQAFKCKKSLELIGTEGKTNRSTGLTLCERVFPWISSPRKVKGIAGIEGGVGQKRMKLAVNRIPATYGHDINLAAGISARLGIGEQCGDLNFGGALDQHRDWHQVPLPSNADFLVVVVGTINGESIAPATLTID
jgi:hypothetical protein